MPDNPIYCSECRTEVPGPCDLVSCPLRPKRVCCGGNGSPEQPCIHPEGCVMYRDSVDLKTPKPGERVHLREVTTIFQHNLLNVPEKLRDLAAQIERGDYGEVGCCAVAVLGDKLHSFSYGPDSAPPSAACVLTAAAQLYYDALKEHGRE